MNWIAVIGATVPAWTNTPRYHPDILVGIGRPSWTQNLYVKMGIWIHVSRAPPAAPTARFSKGDKGVRNVLLSMLITEHFFALFKHGYSRVKGIDMRRGKEEDPTELKNLIFLLGKEAIHTWSGLVLQKRLIDCARRCELVLRDFVLRDHVRIRFVRRVPREETRLRVTLNQCDDGPTVPVKNFFDPAWEKKKDQTDQRNRVNH